MQNNGAKTGCERLGKTIQIARKRHWKPLGAGRPHRVADVSQQRLAEASGLTRSYIAKIERGECALAAEHLRKLEDAMHLRIDGVEEYRGRE
ncbi:MAG: helix-turn-helix domain-containing protein [Candidatus Phaeomarinobacter sp.]